MGGMTINLSRLPARKPSGHGGLIGLPGRHFGFSGVGSDRFHPDQRRSSPSAFCEEAAAGVGINDQPFQISVGVRRNDPNPGGNRWPAKE
jgi:hypothetical protein